MTYEEARAAITILMIADGLPAPDFSDDSKYAVVEEERNADLFRALYWLSKRQYSQVDYTGEMKLKATRRVKQYLESRGQK